MKKKKVWVVLLSVVLGLFVVCCGLYYATRLSTVSVEFRTRLSESESRLPSGILDTVKDSADFNYKDSVLFMNTSENVEKIEKSNPYVKVQQVIRKFPNKVNIYISERIPKYRIVDSENSNNWLILDEDFKVLERISNEDLESQELDEKTVKIEYISQKIGVGEFLQKPTEKDELNAILSGVYGRTKDYFAVRSINYSSESKTFFVTMRTTVESEDGAISYDGGCVVEIENSGSLKDKALNATCVYAGDGDLIANKDLSKKVIIISGEDGCIIKDQG